MKQTKQQYVTINYSGAIFRSKRFSLTKFNKTKISMLHI